MPKIVLHEKALGHLSRGLYRSPASALRELVSNGWDAGATKVTIDTNYPNFHQIVVEDNGRGFSKKEFQRLMQGGIGNSEKRVQQDPPGYGRPTIGRLGIGMLGIAQICLNFTVTSNPVEGTPFRARVKLYDLLKIKLDEEDSDLIHETEGNDDETSLTTIDVGQYEFDNSYDPSRSRKGTRIIADDVHPTFVRSFQESLQYDAFVEPPADWKSAVKICSKFHTLQELGDYWKLLWELSALCPLPYLSSRALPSGLVTEDQERLESYKFSLFVDNRELFKPIYLSGNKSGYTVHRIEPVQRLVYQRPLEFHGYIAVQEGTQIKPDELRGILIRVNNVGIGTYDPTFLDYRYNQGPRSRWLTGEIYVTKGLEDALNVDRDSFNKFHPEYREIQEYVHNVLIKQIFPEVYKKIDVRSAERATVRESTRGSRLSEVLSEYFERPVSIVHARDKEENESLPPVGIEEKKTRTTVTLPPPEQLKTKKAQRQLANAILALFEATITEKNADERRRSFTHLLLELLSKW